MSSVERVEGRKEEVERETMSKLSITTRIRRHSTSSEKDEIDHAFNMTTTEKNTEVLNCVNRLSSHARACACAEQDLLSKRHRLVTRLAFDARQHIRRHF